MNLQVTAPQVRAYLLEHIHDHPAHFLMSSHPFDLEAKELTQQLVGLQKAQKKFPDLFNNSEVVFPPKINLEQTSSQITAFYKSQLVKGRTMVDLTGGWGVDVSAFAKAGFQSTHLEVSASLQPYAVQLFKAQGLKVVSHALDGIDFVYDQLDYADVIYLDPGRKTTASPKAIQLQDYEPNVLDHLDILFQKCNAVLIKTSPMLDLHAGVSQLRNIAEVHIVAVKNEVKELLWLLKKDAVSTSVVCVNLESDQPDFKFDFKTDQSCTNFSEPLKYIYEPNATIMKSQGFKSLAEDYGVYKLDHNAHLFTSASRVDFPGRIFEVQRVIPYQPKQVKKLFGKSGRGVVTRNFKNTVKQLRDKFQFTEHDTDYLFFTSVNGKGAVVIEAVKYS